MSRLRSRLLLGASLGGMLLTAGGAAATHRSVRTQRRRPDAAARTLATPPRVDRVTPVTTHDGLSLHVEEVGPLDAPVTMVFAHGWTCTQATWVYQRRDLAGEDLRLVFYDQRGHGRSERPDPQHSNIDDLGRDLAAVLEAVGPTGPVVLVGHSMGGMTIMALADQQPELFGPGGPVAGVALLSTSAGGVAALTLGLPTALAALLRRTMPFSYKALARYGDKFETRRKAGDVTYVAAKYLGYGGDVPPSLVELMEDMMAQSPLTVTAQFGSALLGHDKLAALPVLGDTSTVIMIGDADVLTPIDHSRAMADALPSADLVVLPGAGHMLMLERPALVTLHLRTLLRSVTGGLAGSSRAAAESA